MDGRPALRKSETFSSPGSLVLSCGGSALKINPIQNFEPPAELCKQFNPKCELWIQFWKTKRKQAMKTMIWKMLAFLSILAMVLGACAAPTPQVVEKIVTQEAQVIEQTKIVEATKLVEATVIVEKVVTPTPVPPI